jgi:hypothetical protein
MSGQFNDPVRVVAFNTLEHWAQDVSRDVALESKAVAISMVTTFRTCFGILSIVTPVPIGSLALRLA